MQCSARQQLPEIHSYNIIDPHDSLNIALKIAFLEYNIGEIQAHRTRFPASFLSMKWQWTFGQMVP